MNSYILWEGASAMDGAPIVLIVSGVQYSANSKTGNMLQTFILRQDILPTDAVKTGLDYSTCGNCPHRPILAKGTGHAVCYVNVGNAANQLWRKYNAGELLRLPSLKLLEGRKLRMGSYGDPAMVPYSVWNDVLKACVSHTGYTSQWREDFAQDFRYLCQASVSSISAQQEALAMGWKTYLNLPKGSEAPVGSVACPNSSDQNIQCLTCGLCNGGKVNVWVEDHGLAWKVRSLV
jgi:hypothetical protein